jgi:hypothetical protein
MKTLLDRSCCRLCEAIDTMDLHSAISRTVVPEQSIDTTHKDDYRWMLPIPMVLLFQFELHEEEPTNACRPLQTRRDVVFEPFASIRSGENRYDPTFASVFRPPFL